MEVGDIIIVRDSYFQNDNNSNPVAGRKGKVILKRKNDCLIDFGVDFSGHRGTNGELRTSTGWYIHHEYLKEYKKGNYKRYA